MLSRDRIYETFSQYTDSELHIVISALHKIIDDRRDEDDDVREFAEAWGKDS